MANTRRTLDPALESLVAKVNKEFGPGTLIMGSDIHYDHLPRMSTGSLSLDVALGGGWTVNSCHEIYGNESSGKTTILMKAIAVNQAKDPNFFTFWVAAEEFVPDWARTLGVDLNRVMILHTNEMEPAYNAVMEAIDSKAADMVVVDSMPALVPVAEDDGNMLDQQMGLAARINGKLFRKIAPVMKRSMVEAERPCTVFFVNQFRDKIGIVYGDPRTTPGGKAKNFAFFTRLELTRDDWLTEGTGRDAHKVGIKIKAHTKKNKTAPPERTAVVDFYFDVNELGIEPGSYDPVQETFALGMYFGVIKRPNAKGASYHYGDEKWFGAPKLMDELRYNLTLREQIRSEVMSCVVKGRRVDEASASPVASPKRTVRKRQAAK